MLKYVCQPLYNNKNTLCIATFRMLMAADVTSLLVPSVVRLVVFYSSGPSKLTMSLVNASFKL